MGDTRVRASARVTLTVELEAGQAWGADCTVAQVRKQAAEAVLDKLNHGLGRNGWRIVGTPSVVQVFAEDEK